MCLTSQCPHLFTLQHVIMCNVVYNCACGNVILVQVKVSHVPICKTLIIAYEVSNFVSMVTVMYLSIPLR